jgi:hypothetical protein
MFPIDEEAHNFLVSSASLGCIVWFFRYRDIILPKQNRTHRGWGVAGWQPTAGHPNNFFYLKFKIKLIKN